MTIGFKTGPRNWEASKAIILEDGAKMCEVWFNVGKETEYDEMFSWLTDHKVQIGLHHWGLAQGELKTNLSTNNSAVREETFMQMQRTIEIGKRLGASYVNVHPGAQWLERINFSTDQQERLEGSATPPEEARKLLLAGARELSAYAKEQGVLFTIETLPGLESNNPVTREGMYDSGNPPLPWFDDIGRQGGFIANDVTHTASMGGIPENTLEAMWKGLQDFTERTKGFTKLLHLNTISPPFDGRDSHNGILDEDFAQKFFPSRGQISTFLQLFRGRDDVFAVTEPELDKTRQNFLALKKIAEEAGVG